MDTTGTYSVLNGPGMSQNKIMRNRWNKSPIRSHLEEQHSIAGKVSPAAAPRLGQPWTIVPAEQQMERKPEGTDFQEFSSHPGTCFYGGIFLKGSALRSTCFSQKKPSCFYNLSLSFLIISFFSIAWKQTTRPQMNNFCLVYSSLATTIIQKHFLKSF